MQTVILVIHLLLALGLIAVILVQRSEGGGLGIGGNSGGGGGGFGVMSSRGAANLLTRTTAILAGAFMITSIILALQSNSHTKPASILEQAPASAPAVTEPAEDTGPAAPTR
ncbi:MULTISPECIES: preprotein translocase subunit SecG [Thalassospira]|jgi:preprotein translocase subunit SecG|uniref:Protein-export membrane protein SecG n=1 Tax=Thalassospira povalilytica TaxID=732237 RepID=A0A8I1M9E1_9PROT|nr:MULTISPECIES: preprotein translocase subunit SecG [Thalassospira]MEE3044473.1 preprotein translocase subunit SecG [Pseudomonadota bacterium]RCK25000.1 preprotein translocase subunit SecG [Thalassospira profundimaris]KZB60700.1 preprotein translocase subunit SecG [Thalassospira sp. MCCC 1A02491]MAL40314.1 preprotein translocase subunit SecG [Thalassospira sp.]MBN8197444.1 preprotein translocase subunit SecG [Thalassospira povalilytica]|tara:strand:+ start:723 stop:1058 length:336 start_codon:yes stop_codon:yes gene_type:complete